MNAPKERTHHPSCRAQVLLMCVYGGGDANDKTCFHAQSKPSKETYRREVVSHPAGPVRLHQSPYPSSRLEALEVCDGEGLEELEAVSERLGEIDELLEGFQSDRLADLAEKVLKGLGFKMTRRAALASSLSGGWQMRLELAAALVEKPQLLLLDEPTNHLDLGALLWLENFLQSNEAPGTVIVVSHDRAFVNNVCTDLLILENQQLKLHPGITFDEYESTRVSRPS